MIRLSLVYLASFLCVLGVLLSCNFDAQNHGKNLYIQYCESCHGADGKGLGRLIPPVLEADFIKESKDRLPCIIRHGIEGTITVNGKTYEGEMAGFSKLSEVDIANLSNYIATSYLSDQKGYTIKDVKDALNNCP